ncbi:MAG TPA: ATP-grasp fold amidoligase family protein [Acidimicrobiales bacterium]|nr:ATP-grasp fold amidoligase family protein [Acidimicrobiales bacterium]
MRARLAWKLRSVAMSPRVPFELRCRMEYWARRRAWPTPIPTTFEQKLLWKMVHDRRPLLTTFADKVAVREYVAERIGPEVLTELYAVVEDPGTLDPTALPREFVVKPNHGSSMVWIVADWGPDTPRVAENTAVVPGNQVTTNRDSLDWDQLVATCRRWLRTDYSDGSREWAYRNIPRKILVEELLGGASGIPADYKFFVCNGVARRVEVHVDRFDDHSVCFFDRDWSQVEADIDFPITDPPPPSPATLDAMLAMAEALGQDTDFVRVDLYDLAGRIVFGELTSYPGGLSAGRYYPEATGLGEHWVLPRRYR